jgi:hypothetical protein
MLKFSIKTTRIFHLLNRINFNNIILYLQLHHQLQLTNRKKIKILLLKTHNYKSLENHPNSSRLIVTLKINIKKS